MADGPKKRAAAKKPAKKVPAKKVAAKKRTATTKRVSPPTELPPRNASKGPTRTPLDGLVSLVGGMVRDVFSPDSAAVDRALSFVSRRLTGDFEVDAFGFDPELTETVLLPLLRPLYKHWFRVEVTGIDNIPNEGAALVVANHSGTVPVDSLMTQLAVHDEHPRSRHLRTLAATLVFQLPVFGDLARRGGSTLACNEDAARLFESGELVGVWPEGFKGVGKPFSERYKLQRFGRGGFVSAALRAGAPIIPCAIVGAEEIYPMLGNADFLARLVGLPYVPITPTFPWLGPLGLVPLPSKWMIEFGEPIRTEAYGPAAADDPMVVFDLTDRVRDTIQETLHTLLERRGSAFG